MNFNVIQIYGRVNARLILVVHLVAEVVVLGEIRSIHVLHQSVEEPPASFFNVERSNTVALRKIFKMGHRIVFAHDRTLDRVNDEAVDRREQAQEAKKDFCMSANCEDASTRQLQVLDFTRRGHRKNRACRTRSGRVQSAIYQFNLPKDNHL